ncbi:MAG: hypothetical protein E7610_09685 [Ruminococcaceae bacterium]|nr:hypothetical protein [Oscillospiraceae bacterium]
MWLNKLLYSSTGEPSLFQELWEYFEKKYFSVDTGRYEHLNIGSGGLVTLQRIVLGLFAGIIVAAAMIVYDKNRLGAFVRTIVREQCLWPEKAKTLSELGFYKNSGVKASLRSPNQLGKIVRCVEKEAYEQQVEEARAAYAAEHGDDKDFFMPGYRIDFENDHFYIPDEEHYRAEIRYDEKGSGWRAFLLVVLLAIVGAALVCFLLPEMLQMVDNMIDILSSNDRYLTE